MVKIGIDNMGFYIPPFAMDVTKLVKRRSDEMPELAGRLHSAIKTTGQRFIRFTKRWQDSVTLAAEAVIDIAKSVPFDTLKFFISATETSVDGSKPVAAFVLGILEKYGIPVPKNLVSYQTQHACAAGLISILQAMAMIRALGQDASAVVTASDIARYTKNTTAEITQGSGAVALHISKNPRLMELAVDTCGFFSSDVDDFFRPPHRSEACVRGQFSMKCYNIAAYGALENLAAQHGVSVEQVLSESDYVVFHVPFYSMPFTALRYIMRTKLGYTTAQYEQFLKDKYIHETCEIVSHIGNTYTASTFFALGGVLERHFAEGKDINGKNVLIISYGSGNTCLAMRGATTNKAHTVVGTWNLWRRLGDNGTKSAQAEYDEWMNDVPPYIFENSADTPSEIQLLPDAVRPSVYLRGLRESDEYRIYDVISPGGAIS